jgi:hypothetical protein
MKRLSISVLALSALGLFFALSQFTRSSTAQSGNFNGPINARPAATPVKPVTPPKHPLDKGDFKVGFSPISRAQQPKKAMPKDEAAMLQEIATSLNELIALPRDVYLNFDACGEANAFYSSDTTEVTICYELADQFEQEFKAITKDQAKIDDMVGDTIMQAFFHELGHCLIDVLDLPATGREEDAVDQLATILILDGSPEGRRSAINAALEFNLASRDTDPNDMAFWDEHSFSKTRFYDMLCLVYGSDPKSMKSIIGPDGLPEERAVRCTQEYERAEKAWMRLLEPFIIK